MSKIKRLFYSFGITIIAALFAGAFTSDSSIFYNSLVLPSFAPASIVFALVWPVLYFMMSLAMYLVLGTNKGQLLIRPYVLQLVLNVLWSLLFFKYNFALLPIIDIILLVIVNLVILKGMWQYRRIAAYIYLPYVLWIIFATILNISIVYLNW